MDRYKHTSIKIKKIYLTMVHELLVYVLWIAFFKYAYTCNNYIWKLHSLEKRGVNNNERILQNMDFLLYLNVFHGKTFYSMLQNQSIKILLCWFLSLSNIEQIKNFKTLNTGLVISSNEDKIQYFMKLRLHKLIS